MERCRFHFYPFRKKRVHRRLWSSFETQRIKISSVPTFVFFFPTCKRSLSFRNRSASFFLSKRMRTCPSSFRFHWLYRFRSQKTTCKHSLPVSRFSEDRALFYPFHNKTCACKRSIFIGTVPTFLLVNGAIVALNAFWVLCA